MIKLTIFRFLSFSLFIFFCFVSQAVALDQADAKAQALAHYTMGLSYDLNELPDKAIAEYLKAAELDPNNYAIHLKLGVVYARAEKMDKAVEELKKASDLNTQDIEAHYLLAVIYSSQAKEDKASGEYEVILNKLVQQDPQGSEALGLLGQLYYSQGKIQLAIEQFEKMLLADPKNAKTLSILGSLYLELPRREKAAEYFRKSIEQDPRNDGSLNSLGYLYAEDGKNLDEAISLIKRALEVDPENGAYLDSMGWAYYQKGDYPKAYLFLKRALEFYKDPIIYDHLADTVLKMDDRNSAVYYWEKSLEMEPLQGNVSRKLEALKKTLPAPEVNQTP